MGGVVAGVTTINFAAQKKAVLGETVKYTCDAQRELAKSQITGFFALLKMTKSAGKRIQERAEGRQTAAGAALRSGGGFRDAGRIATARVGRSRQTHRVGWDMGGGGRTGRVGDDSRELVGDEREAGDAG